MNHQKIYSNIIEKAKLEHRIKFNKININYVYYENHHIIPKCLDGNNDEENLVLLTAKEHFICHKLLTYIYKGNRKIALAFHKMAFSRKHNELVSSRDYAYAREIVSLTPVSLETRKKQSEKAKGISRNKGKKHTLEQNKKTSDVTRGKNNGMYGKKHTDKSIEKNRKSNMGKKRSEETKKKIANSNRGKIRNKETKEKMKIAWKTRRINYKMSKETKKKIGINTTKCLTGRHHSKETKQKQSESQKGKKQKIIICIYCGKHGSPSTISRWHNNNCKFKV